MTTQKYLLLFLACFMVRFAMEAKKIKFAVDMSGQTINPTGVHLAGDFQTLAGYPDGDFNSGSTLLQKEGTTNIYSIVLNLPAFRKYEYYFVNGDQSYEAEFVKEPSRVGYEFNANRWLFLDSLSADTFSVGAIVFGENAPAGMKLVRFVMDMTNSGTTEKAYVAGTFNGWNFPKARLFSFGANVFEIIQYAPAGNYEYTFAHGPSLTQESVPVACASTGGKRTISLTSDSVLSVVCFGSCSACVTTVSEFSSAQTISAYPNPSENRKVTLSLSENSNRVEVYSAKGERILNLPEYEEKSLELYLPSAGIYLVKVQHKSALIESSTVRIVAH